jgi:translocation and assembly module TamA
MRKKSTLLILSLALSSPAAIAQISISAPAGIAEMITPHLRDNSSLQGGKRLASQILATEGYFSPGIEIDPNAHETLNIDPGPRTRIKEVDVTVDGPLDEKFRQTLLDTWHLPVGQPFRQADWNIAKQHVLAELLAVEHAGARLLNSLAAIDMENHQAAVSAHYDAGPRYRFGPLQIDGLSLYSPELLARYNQSARPGMPYRAESLTSLVSKLQASPYFTSVQAELDIAAAQIADDGTAVAPIRLRVRERAAHRAAFGAGFSSNTGARVEANYKTPNLFGKAWELDTGLRLEQKQQTLYGDVFLPPDARQRRHSVGAVRDSSDIENLKISRYAFGAQSVQQRGQVEQRLALSWQHERRTPEGAEAVTSRALVPNVTWTWRQVDDPINPRDGHILQLSIGGGAKAALSDQNFLRLHGRWQHYLPIGQRDTLILRAELGRTLADSRLNIPQDYLFRTGGTGSVRGYGYQSLGVREGNATVGGLYMAVGSAEYTHWLGNDWGIAAFVDAGDAVDTLRDAKLAVGYGVGVRWRSPAGPIAADLAYGERDRQVQLHLSLAIPF